MVWGIFRITIFGVAFLLGAAIASLWNPLVVPQAATDAAQLSGLTETSLLVTCDHGYPTVQQVQGSGAVEVKCARSDMQIMQSPPVPRRERKVSPSSIAALISHTFLRDPE